MEVSTNPPMYYQKNNNNKKKKEPFSRFDEYKNHNKKHEEFEVEKKEHKDN